MKKFLSVLLAMGVITWALSFPANAQVNPPEAKAEPPDVQAGKLYRAIRAQDYKAMFYLTAFPPKGKATLTTAEQFAIDMRKGYEGSFKTKEEQAVTDRIFQSIAEIMIGEPVITDDKAVVPTSAKITANGQTRTFKGQAHMIKDEGIWKLDLTFTEDSEQAMSQRTSELFGKPDPSP